MDTKIAASKFPERLDLLNSITGARYPMRFDRPHKLVREMWLVDGESTLLLGDDFPEANSALHYGVTEAALLTRPIISLHGRKINASGVAHLAVDGFLVEQGPIENFSAENQKPWPRRQDQLLFTAMLPGEREDCGILLPNGSTVRLDFQGVRVSGKPMLVAELELGVYRA